VEDDIVWRSGDLDERYRGMGFGGRVGFGDKPALILIDYFYGVTDETLSPLGFDQSEAIAHSRRVLDMAREKRIPIIFTTQAYAENCVDAGVSIKKIPTMNVLVAGSKAVEIDERVKPESHELLIVKKQASAFFGTHLAPLLWGLGVDTAILVGNSTSGCVRATCVDSCSNGFRTIIPRECVADRSEQVHEASLFDMDSKFADVVPCEEVLAYLRGLPRCDSQ
jgi:nicotinamidase-related amidase